MCTSDATTVENDRIHPFVNGFVTFAFLAHLGVVPPDVLVEITRDIKVEDDDFAQQQPPVARPEDEPEDV